MSLVVPFFIIHTICSNIILEDNKLGDNIDYTINGENLSIHGSGEMYTENYGIWNDTVRSSI